MFAAPPVSPQAQNVRTFSDSLKKLGLAYLEKDVESLHVYKAICTICDRAGLEQPNAADVVSISLTRILAELRNKVNSGELKPHVELPASLQKLGGQVTSPTDPTEP